MEKSFSRKFCSRENQELAEYDGETFQQKKARAWSAGSNLQCVRNTSQPAKPVDFWSDDFSIGKLSKRASGVN